MIYGPNSAPGASVIDADSGQRLLFVRSIDTAAATVELYPSRQTPAGEPFLVRALDERGDLQTRRVAFDAIHDIYGNARTPQVFLCYGRKA